LSRSATHTAAGDAAGYFPPDSMIWRLSRERSLLLGGGRALLMQVAHPLVAAGVSDHSDYRENPWRRLEGTMSSVWTAVFGTRAEADRIGARVRSMHKLVRGRTARRLGPYPAGTAYSASDPELLMWVHATLVETALAVYESWVSPLSDRERASYYEDMKLLAQIFGTPSSVIPPTLGEFRAYMSERLESDEICATPTAREIADSVLHPPLPAPLRPAWRIVGLVTAGLLPPKLRDQYGLGWDPARRALFGVSREWVRRVAMPLLPDMIRAVPAARGAEHEDGRREDPELAV
jgi:uncharacterized protein (DUF2236 family)